MAAAANKAGIVHVLLSFIESAVSLFIYTQRRWWSIVSIV
jgi:hypothetical protein